MLKHAFIFAASLGLFGQVSACGKHQTVSALRSEEGSDEGDADSADPKKLQEAQKILDAAGEKLDLVDDSSVTGDGGEGASSDESIGDVDSASLSLDDEADVNGLAAEYAPLESDSAIEAEATGEIVDEASSLGKNVETFVAGVDEEPSAGKGSYTGLSLADKPKLSAAEKTKLLELRKQLTAMRTKIDAKLRLVDGKLGGTQTAAANSSLSYVLFDAQRKVLACSDKVKINTYKGTSVYLPGVSYSYSVYGAMAKRTYALVFKSSCASIGKRLGAAVVKTGRGAESSTEYNRKSNAATGNRELDKFLDYASKAK